MLESGPWTSLRPGFFGHVAALVLLVALAGAETATAQTTTVNFDAPAPPGSSFSFLNGVFQGMDFGTGQWRWESAYNVDPTNHIFFDSPSGTSRTFRFSPAPRILTSLRVFTSGAGTLTLSDDRGQTLARAVPTGSMQLVTTAWGLASTVITVAFTSGWNLGIDDIIYTVAGGADTTPPTVSLTGPPDGAVVAGTVPVSAQAADNVGVVGVQFLLNGAALGPEDTLSPYATSWNTTSVVNGSYTLTAVARDAAMNQTTSAPVRVTVANGLVGGAGYALRFHGNGVNDIDRVKIQIDDPATTAPGPPADVGATDFTLEFWLRALAAENPAPAVACGANNNWIFGNIVVDRDRFNQDRAFGLSIAGGRVVFGVDGQGTGRLTLCGTSNVLDNQWHHIAVQRRRADGWLWLYVDGRLEAQGDGPDGDISYPDNGVPGNFCGGPCTNSDPYLVLGAEKHDAGPQFPSFAGWLDEFRLSNVLRYAANFPRPPTPFLPDANTVALYHFDEGSGDAITDTRGVSGGPSHGVRRFGGSPAGPEWVPSDAPLANGQAQVGQWSAPFSLPIVAVNMILLRTGQVLMWDGDTNGGDARLWNPALGTFTSVPNNLTNLFCSGQIALPDGRALVVGGHQAGFVGVRDANAFDPLTRTWQPAAPMAFPRWYPTATTLPDGRVLVTSGTTTCSTCLADTPEIYDPASNTWTQLSGARLTMPLYPFMFVLPDGRVLFAGSDEANTNTQALDMTMERWTMVDPVVVTGGSAAMYWPGMVIKAGSPGNVDLSPTPASNTAYVIDLNQPSPAWRQVGSMSFPRTYHTLTMLPDGNVVVTGGVQTTDEVSAPGAYAAEIWNAQAETWTTMAAMQIRRSYHSTALLLPDGRVLVAGSGRFAPMTNELNAEIFSSPYLFRGTRPTITSAPTTVSVGTAFFVGTPDGNDIESAALVRLGAVTHQIDMDQRYLRLPFGLAAGGLTVQAPASPNLTPPGYYMLFLVNTAGVPSVAAFVQISASSVPNPVPMTTGLNPTSAPAGGAAFTLTVNGTNFINGSVVRWNGANRTTMFVSSARLTASIPNGDIATMGTASVTVFNPAPGGGTSNAQTFTISSAPNPLPTTTGLSPASAPAGGPAFTLTVNGTNFVVGSMVRWNGVNRTTTFVSSAQVAASIPVGDIATAGTAQVTVFNPVPGGGTSNAQTFTISAASGTTTTVTFDNPVPPGSSGSFLNGLFQGINFGTNQWSWENAYGPDSTRHIYFASSSGTSRTFTFSPGPRTLVSLRVFTGAAGTLTLTDNVGQSRTQAITTGSMQLVTTGWTQASTMVTVAFTAGWELGVDDIVYRTP